MATFATQLQTIVRAVEKFQRHSIGVHISVDSAGDVRIQSGLDDADDFAMVLSSDTMAYIRKMAQQDEASRDANDQLLRVMPEIENSVTGIEDDTVEDDAGSDFADEDDADSDFADEDDAGADFADDRVLPNLPEIDYDGFADEDDAGAVGWSAL